MEGLVIRSLEQRDIIDLEPVLREHVKDRDTGEIVEQEIQDIKSYMQGDLDTEECRRTYLVAEHEGTAVGCIAYTTPDKDMRKHFSDTYVNSAELVNAFVSSEYSHGKGVGKALFQRLCNKAKAAGFDYILLNSGPRYKASWGFYDRVCDGNKGFIVGKFGEGGDAKTWYKKL